MLLRLGRIVYLCIFALLILVWTGAHDGGTRNAVNKGWDMTAHAFGQGSSFAFDDVVAPDSEKEHTNAVETGVETLQKQDSKPIETPSPYAYVFYATQDSYACSVLVNIHQLQDVHKTPHRIFVLITQDLSSIYVSALKSTGATISLQTPPALNDGSEGFAYYHDCLLKLLTFKMHHIDSTLKRVIVLDSDQLVLKTLDHLFDMDDLNVDLAAPRAYWIAKETFSTAFLVITLSDRTWRKVETALENVRINQYDMDMANELFGEEVLMLPGNFVALNSHWEDWNLPRWFHQPESIDAGSNNGTGVQELAKWETKDLNKRQEEVRKNGYEFEASNYEPTSVASKAKDSTTTSTSPSSDGTIPGITTPSEHSDGNPYLQGEVAPPSDIDLTTIETSINHMKTLPIYKELFELYKQVSVLHYTAMAKPWGTHAQMIDEQRPDAHPLLKEQFMAWRKVAKDICPSDLVVDL